MALFQPPYPPQELKTFGNFEVKQDDSSRLGIFNPSGTEIWDINASGDVTVGGTLLATGLATFDAGITGTGNTGSLTAGSGILGTANTWSALQTFGNDISFGGATLSVASLATNDLLQYNGSNWVNVLPSSLGLVNSVSNSDGTLTISPTTGAVVASLNLGNANTWTALQTFGNNISIGGATLDVVTLTTGNFLYYNGTDWINQSLAAGTGISVSDYTITNTGIISLSAGSGISISGTNPATITNTGVLSISNSDGSLTISPTTGDSVASLNVGHANTWTALQTFNSGISIPANYGITLNTTASEDGQITFATTGAYYTGIEFTNSTDHTYSWLVNYNSSPIYALEVYDFTSNINLFNIDSSGNATTHGNMTLGGTLTLNGAYSAANAFEIISTAGAGIVLNEAADTDYELISFTYGGVLTNAAWVVGLNGNFSIFDIGYTSDLNTVNPTNYLMVGSGGSLNSYKNTLDDGSGNMTVAGTVTSANKTVYTSGSGTYTVPANTTTLRISLLGGGGGGGAGNGSSFSPLGGTGGGSGAYLIAVIDTSSGSTFSYSVGAGGAGGAAAKAGAAGGNTSFGIFTAGGGGGGAASGGTPGAGAALPTYGVARAGNGGGANSSGDGGAGGNSALAAGGAGGTSGAGSPGGIGAGGGGGYYVGAGGNGGAGLVIVEAW